MTSLDRVPIPDGDPDYPPLDPGEPAPDDPGPLLPDDPGTLPPAPPEPEIPDPASPPGKPEEEPAPA